MRVAMSPVPSVRPFWWVPLALMSWVHAHPSAFARFDRVAVAFPASHIAERKAATPIAVIIAVSTM